MPDVSKVKLLEHLKTKSDHKNLLIHAVLAGLITAIQRGDFDTEKDH